MKIRYRCPICKRDKFDRPYEPHKCRGGYRKKLPPFEPIVVRVPKVIIRAYGQFIIGHPGKTHYTTYYDDEITGASRQRLWAMMIPKCQEENGRYLYWGKKG